MEAHVSARMKIGLKLGLFSVTFLSLTVICALGLRNLLHDDSIEIPRDPASVKKAVTGGLFGATPAPIFDHRGAIPFNDLGLMSSTPSLIRGRHVAFDESEFLRDYASGGHQITLNLFPDKVLTLDMDPQSAEWSHNDSLFTARIAPDDTSSVRMYLSDHILQATFDYQGLQYEIGSDGKGGLFVLESRKP